MVETGSGDHALELAARLGAKWVYNITISPIQSFENVLKCLQANVTDFLGSEWEISCIKAQYN